MGQIIQKVMRRIGVNEKTINQLFQTNSDRMEAAIVQGDLSKVIKLSQNKFDFGELLSTGENFLHLAVKLEKIDIVHYIIDIIREKDDSLFPLIEQKNLYGDTPLMLAVMNKNLSLVKYLVENGNANINAKENNGSSIFMAACASGSLEIVKYFHDLVGINIYCKNNDGQNALHRACHYGELQIITFLVENCKMSTLSKDKAGNNCFHIAANRINMSVIRLLLKKFKKYHTVMLIPNGEGQTLVQILLNIFNQIKEESLPLVTDKDVIRYIEDKYDPPEIFTWVIRNKELFKNQPQLKGQWKPKKNNDNEEYKKKKSIRFEQQSVRDKSERDILATPLNQTPSHYKKRQSVMKNTYIQSVKNDKNRAPLINKPDFNIE